jgi:hypothetical protein
MRSRTAGMKTGNYGWKTLSLIFFLPLAYLLATAVTSTNDYYFLIVVTAIIFLTIVINFQFSLLIIAFSCYVFPYLIWVFDLPGPLINLTYALIIMVFVRQYFFSANPFAAKTPINYLLLLLIALGVLSMLLSDSVSYPAMKGLLRHVGFPLLFIMILISESDERLMRQILWGIIIVVFLQVVVSIFQFGWYSTINPKSFGTRADLSGGTLGPNCGPPTAILACMVFCLLMGFILVSGVRWYLIVGVIALAIPIYLASARAGILYYGAAAFFMLLVAPLRKHGSFFPRLVLAVSIPAIIIVAGAMGLLGGDFKVIMNLDYVYQYSAKQADSGMGRLQAFDIVSAQLSSPLTRLIGLGPGAVTPTSIVDNPNSLIASNPTLFRNLTGFTYTTLELGYIGLFLFLLIYMKLYRINRRFLKATNDPFWEAVSLGYCGVVFIYVTAIFYIDAWITYPLPFTFWCLTAALYRMGVIRGMIT